MISDFDSWWNERFFYREPVYDLCRALYFAGADFSYVATYCYLFIESDYLSSHFEKDLRAQVNRFNVMVRDDPKAEEWEKQFAKRKQGLYREDFERGYLRELEERDRKEFGFSAKQKAKIKKEVSAILKTTPFRKQKEFSEPFLKYSGSGRLSGPGRRDDTSGALFLIVISEHLRSLNGRPNNRLAASLLKLARGTKANLRGRVGISVSRRVKNLKTAHPEWKTDLLAIEKNVRQYFHQHRKAFKKLSEDPTSYCRKQFLQLPESWRTELVALFTRIRPLIAAAVDGLAKSPPS